MKITNIKNLPEALVNAITFDDYSKGESDISTTSLWKSPRLVALETKFHDQISQDASERIWVLFGKCIHEILRRSDTEAITEARLVDDILGWNVSGQFDRFVKQDGLLQDYKVTSAWSMVFDSKHKDWTNQLNTYAHLLRKHGHEVNKMEVVAILRDWSAKEARTKPTYPQSPVQVVSIDLWDKEFTKAALEERVKKHSEAKISLPLCTPEEQWAKPDVYAVMKDGQKRALSLALSEEQAAIDKALFEKEHKSKKIFVVKRPGEKTRCESYCSVKQFCDQYQQEKQVSVEP